MLKQEIQLKAQYIQYKLTKFFRQEDHLFQEDQKKKKKKILSRNKKRDNK